MPLQAYIDDSKTMDRVLTFGGYVADYEAWENLSVEWRHHKRAEGFYRLIEKHALAFLACAVDSRADAI